MPITRVLAEQIPPATVALNWPAAIGGYTIQRAPNLSSSSNVWQNMTNAVNQTSGRNQVTIPAATNQEYYRLRIGLDE